MNQNIKVLILDIDGTIAGASNQVTSRVKEVIKKVQHKGIKVGLATGRMYCSALRFHQDIGADLPIIGYNGAWMQNPVDSQMLFHQPVDQKKIVKQLLDYFRQQQQNSDLQVHLYFDDRLYVENFTAKTDYYVKRAGITANVVDDFSSLLTRNPTKLLALSDDSQLISLLLTDLKKIYTEDELYLTQSSPVYLEATQPLVNKGTTVKYLVEKILGLTSDQVMTMGDNLNDYEMLDYAGLGVAMGTAPLEVKQIANTVTSSVEEDGVAEAIDRFLLS